MHHLNRSDAYKQWHTRGEDSPTAKICIKVIRAIFTDNAYPKSNYKPMEMISWEKAQNPAPQRYI